MSGHTMESLQCVVDVIQYNALNKQDLLEYALNEALKMTSSRYGYIYHYDEELKLFTLNSWSHGVMGACNVTNSETRYELDKTGIWGESVRQRKPIMVNDFEAPDPLKKGFPDGHVSLTRFLTIPLFDKSRIVAVVGVANKEEVYDDSDVVQLTLLMAVVWKVEERKRFELDLVHQSALLRSIIDSIPDLIFYKDTNSVYLGCNKAFEQFTGRPEQEQVGKTDFDFFDRKVADYFRQMDCEMLAGGEARSNEEWITYPDGHQVLLDTLKTPFWGPDGTLLGLVGISRDISERKLAEAKLKESQALIIQQEKMASIGQLAAGVAHEINNPMGYITSNMNSLWKYAEKLAQFIEIQEQTIERCADEASKASIVELKRQIKLDFVMKDFRDLIVESLEGSKRVSKIVQDLKSFSRAEGIDAIPADLNECIKTTLNVVKNEIKYVAELDICLGDIPLVVCRPQQISQVVMNLLVNAAHSISGKGLISLATTQVDESVEIRVTDTGCGISPENMEKIFEPFFTTKEAGKGTGLGLAISCDIVRKHGGELLVKSEVGIGTTFTVRLPVEGKRK